jgi:heavy metal sensor kinase
MTRRFGPRSLRASLTMWYVGAIVVVLTAYVLVVFGFVSRNLSNALDDRLRDDFQWALAMADIQPDGTLKWFDDEGSETGNSPWLTVWSHGNVIFRTAVAERNPVPAAEGVDADQRIAAVKMEHTTVRVLKGRTNIYGREVVVQVVRSEASMRRQLRELVLLLLLGLPLGVAVAGVGGYVMARRALAPIERMADHARTISAERLSDRLPVDIPNDELGRLASVFNSTLGRLEASFEHMRRFATDVSHELRTPLTAMRSVGEVALRDRRDPHAYRAVIVSMLEEVDRLGTLVDRLLTFARGSMGRAAVCRETIDLHGLAEEVAAQLGVLAEEKEQSVTMHAQGTPLAIGDPIGVRQAVMNLVDNAIKYTPAGGQIAIRVWDTTTSAVLEVSDNGPGIPTEARQRIFDRFYRADSAGSVGSVGGFGLGLSIAKWSVEASGGQLRLESPDHAGSTFRVTLPLASSARMSHGRRRTA